MVVDNLYVAYVSVLPLETDPPLTIDSNTVLSPPITFKLLQTIRWWNFQIINDGCCIKHSQLTPSTLLNFRWQTFRATPLENIFSTLVFE